MLIKKHPRCRKLNTPTIDNLVPDTRSLHIILLSFCLAREKLDLKGLKCDDIYRGTLKDQLNILAVCFATPRNLKKFDKWSKILN